MPNIKRYLRQTCEWRPLLSETPDRHGNWQHGPPQTIPCRHTTKQKQVNAPASRTHTDVSIYWTAQEISIGDLINGEEIKARQNVVDRKGRILFWQSNPRPPLGFTP